MTEAEVAHRAALTGTTLTAQRQAVSVVDEPILTIGGGCGVEPVPVGTLRERHRSVLGVAWFDTHPDLETPGPRTTGRTTPWFPLAWWAWVTPG